MSNTNQRPTTVPKEAVWNWSQGEWELGEKNESGKYIGEWKWWLAPNWHLCCHTFFDENWNMLSFKRFHPNGEVSRYGTFENGEQVEDIYLKSTESTTEIFAYWNSDDNVYKAVKKIGSPVSFDYYDREGNHLNPEIKKKVLFEKTEISSWNIKKIKSDIYKNGQSFLWKQFDANFYNNTIIPILEEKTKEKNIQYTEVPEIVTHVVNQAISNKQDVVFHKGDLHLSDLHSLYKLWVWLLIVDWDLEVDNTISLIDDPMQLLLVTGNVIVKDITTSGFLFVFWDLIVKQSVLGDYNDGSAFIGWNISAQLFYPEEYFFEVLWDINFDYAFGNSWRLNQNDNPEAFNWNDKKLSDLIENIHSNILSAADFSQNKALLEKPCSEEGLFEFIDNYEFMNYCRANKPVFK